MNNQILLYLMIGTGGLFCIILIAYVMLNNKLKSKETKYIAQLVEGTKTSGFNMDVFYQKIYIYCYVLKVRRRIEIVNL